MSELALRTGQSSIRVGCHRLAYDSSARTAYVIGLHGPESSLRAVRAVLCDPQIKGHLEAFEDEDDSYGTNLRRAEAGYRCHKHRLCEHTWQFVFVADDPALLLSADDESLWRALMGERYTTPLLREWLPAIRAELESAGMLKRLSTADGNGYQAPALLSAENNDLDAIVTDALKGGTIAIA